MESCPTSTTRAHAFDRLLSETPEIADYIRELKYDILIEDFKLTILSIWKSLKRISRLEFLSRVSYSQACYPVYGPKRNSTGAPTQSAQHCFTSYIFLPLFTYRRALSMTSWYHILYHASASSSCISPIRVIRLWQLKLLSLRLCLSIHLIARFHRSCSDVVMPYLCAHISRKRFTVIIKISNCSLHSSTSF